MASKEIKTNKEEKENKNKNKKSFFKGFKAELKKVIWPTPKQLLNSTVAVISIVLITAVIVFVLDLTFEAINKNGIDKIKESVVQSTNKNNTNTNSTSTNNTTENNTNSNEQSTNQVEETNSIEQ